jgi:hypothetical protein
LGNVCVIEVDVSRMFVYGILMDSGLSMPENRSQMKDTREYMALMNSKVEFMKDAVLRDPYGTTHFAWLDFSVNYTFKDSVSVFSELKTLGSFVPARGLFVPGCWENRGGTADSYCSYIRWRFVAVFSWEIRRLFCVFTIRMCRGFRCLCRGRVALRGR